MIPRSRFSFSISSRISIIPCGSRPFTGSSSTKRSGSPARATAMPSRWRIPSEKLRTFFLPVPSSPTSRKSPVAPSYDGTPSTRYCMRMFSSAVISEYIDGVSTTAPMRRRLFLIARSVFLRRRACSRLRSEPASRI